MVKTNKQAGQQDQIGEKRKKQSKRGKHTQRNSAAKFRKGKNDETKKQHERSIYHADATFAKAEQDGLFVIAITNAQFLLVFAQEVNRAVDRNTKSNTECKRRAGFQRDAH